MKRFALLLALAGCTPPETNQVYTPEGQKVDLAYMVLAPLCVLFCNTAISTTGSKVEGGGSNTQTSTLTNTGSSP